MPGDRYFLDTNILVYANDASDPAKQAAAVKLIGEGLRSGRGVISTQVLGEFWVTVTKKIAVPLDGETAEAEICRRTILWNVIGIYGKKCRTTKGWPVPWRNPA